MACYLLYWAAQQFMGLLFAAMSAVNFLSGGKLFFRLRVVGTSAVKKLRRPVILTPNHKTYADHFFIAAAFLFNFRILPMRTITADWAYRVPAIKLGFLLRGALGLLGAFPERGGMGLLTAFKTIRKGQSVAVYPEGIAWPETGIAEVKKGAAWLASKTGAPILPAAIKGIEHFGGREFFFGKREITVSFGSPFRIGPSDDLDAASQKIKSKIEELYYQNA